MRKDGIMKKSLRSLAIICPLSDYGINGYSFELAEALGLAGLKVDVFTNHSSIEDFPQAICHRRFPVLGGELLKQLKAAAMPRSPEARRAGSPVVAQDSPRQRSNSYAWVRRTILGIELPLYLKYQGYDAV